MPTYNPTQHTPTHKNLLGDKPNQDKPRLWEQADRGTAEPIEFKSAMIEAYTAGGDNYSRAESILREQGWDDNQIGDLRDDVVATYNQKPDEYLQVQSDIDYRRAITHRNTIQERLAHIEETPSINWRDERAGLESDLAQQNAKIQSIISGDLTKFAELDASVDNFKLLFSNPNERKQFNELQHSAARILQLTNPTREIEYRQGKLYVDNNPVTPTIWQQIKASPNEAFIGGAEIGVGVGLARAAGVGARLPGPAKAVGVAGMALLGAAGATFGAKQDRDRALSNFNLFISQAYEDELNAENFALNLAGYAAGEAVASGIPQAYKSVFNLMTGLGKEKHVSDKVIKTLARKSNTDMNQLAGDTLLWIQSLGEQGHTQVAIADRGFRAKIQGKRGPFKSEDDALENVRLQDIKALHPNDQQLLYFIHTNPDATKTLAHVIDEFPDIGHQFLGEAAKVRGDNLVHQLNSIVTKDFDNSVFNNIADDVDAALKTARDGYERITTEYGNSVKGIEIQELIERMNPTGSHGEINRLYKKQLADTGYTVEEGGQPAILSFEDMFNIYRQANKKYGKASISTQNKQNMDKFLDFIVNKLENNRPNPIIKNKDGTSIDDIRNSFRQFVKEEVKINELYDRTLLKALRNPNLGEEGILNVFQRYNEFNKLTPDDYNTIKSIAGDRFKEIEKGIVLSAIGKHSISVFDGMLRPTRNVINFPALQTELKGFRPDDKSIKDMLDYIQVNAILYRNDYGITAAFGQSLQTNPSTGASIAEDLLSKARVHFTSAAYEAIQTHLPGTKFNFAAQVRKPVLRYFTDDPLNQKTFDEMVEFGRQAGLTKGDKDGN